MAQDTTLQGLRNQMLTSLFGRRLGFDKNDSLVGVNDVRSPIEGWSSAGSTFPSTGLATLSAFGIAVAGSSGSSGSTSQSPACQQLPAPTPGVYKTLYNASTAVITYGTTASGAVIQATAGSTFKYLTLAGRGANAMLVALSTDMWGVAGGNANSSFSTNVLLA